MLPLVAAGASLPALVFNRIPLKRARGPLYLRLNRSALLVDGVALRE